MDVSAASAGTTQTKVKRAYKNYVRKYLSSHASYPYGTYSLYDINRDGVSEMVFTYMSGVRGGYKIYTYKKGKIIKMLDVKGAGGIRRNARKKQICISFSNGASDSWATCYKMKGQKLIRVRKYHSISEFKGPMIRFYWSSGPLKRQRGWRRVRTTAHGTGHSQKMQSSLINAYIPCVKTAGARHSEISYMAGIKAAVEMFARLGLLKGWTQKGG